MKARAGKVLAVASVVLCSAVALAPNAWAITVPGGAYYTDVIGGGTGSAPAGYTRNDDGSFGAYSLGFAGGLTLFGSTYSSFYLNNNGSISFGAPAGPRLDDALNRNTQAPMIAPYSADVDTRPANGGTVSVRNLANQIIITWDRVGYFDQHTDRTASFQLVLRGNDYVVPSDEGRIGFFYRELGWESGDSTGSGGFGGVEALVGFGDGLLAVNSGEFAFPLSGQAGIGSFLQNNHYWFNLAGADGLPGLAVPEPGTLLLIAAGLIGVVSIRRRV